MEYTIKSITTNVEWFSIQADTEEEAREIFESEFSTLTPFDYDETISIVVEED